MTPFVPLSTAQYRQSLLDQVQAVFGGVEQLEEAAPMEDAPFSVTEEYQLGDLSEVKEDRVVLPVQSGVKFRVQKASQRISKDGSIKSVTVELRLVDGIPIPGSEELRYKNKPMFVDMPYWTTRTTPRYAGKNQSYLVPLKQFFGALGYDAKSPPLLGDGFYSEILGRELLGDITVREIRLKNPISGEYEGTGEYRNDIRRFQAA